MAVDSQRAKALGDFLRSRRHRTSPEEFDLPGSPRRRTPGLRREEVAQLAGVSLTWYTWLEQGRTATSRQVLLALARTLQMTSEETAHLISLSEPARAGAQPAATGVSEHLQAFVRALDPHPAYVVDRCWDLLAWNRAEEIMLAGFETIPEHRRNMLWMMFCWPRMREMLGEWKREARMLLGQFRARSAEYADDPRFSEIAEEVLASSEDARAWWESYEIQAFRPAVKNFQHPVAGHLRMRYVKLATVDLSNHFLVAYVPADQTSEARLRRLVAGHGAVDLASAS
ncbi:helix-turn-helix transcriptional regulator [Kitasatospora sp. GP82]|uniref:helix-turn-helix transcriptional regulator n=1 Tax=Kitasatospora sp. GP82 TaxID=3035089 RepID=UPI002476655D|nr:helix-turn-helix transcriptional regulator [Kitasatospora sp. GP82]